MNDYIIMDCKKISNDIKCELKHKILELKQHFKSPTLALISIGENSAASIYQKSLIKNFSEFYVDTKSFNLPADIDEKILYEKIEALNTDKNINCILVNMPIPEHFDKTKLFNKISPLKDIEGLTPFNIGRLNSGNETIAPCTALGVVELLERYDIDIKSKNCVIIGASNIVGKPLAALLLNRRGTITITHKDTLNLKKVCKEADILVVSVGNPNFITKDYVKKDAIVIDVGINKLNGKIVGDVNFDEVAPICSYITKVPGGVGTLTVSMLLSNFVKACKFQYEFTENQLEF